MSRAEEPERIVRRRRVFYIPGYDPIHPRRYRELYRKESATQAAISGYDISLSAKQGDGPYGWHVISTQDGITTEADFEVLIWSDIVRESMGASILATYGQLFRTAWIYASTGALFRLIGLRKGPMIAALYPVFALLLQLIVGILLGWACAALVLTLLPAFPFDALIGLAVGGAVLIAVLRWFRARDGKVFAWYLMHDFAFSARWRGANPPRLEARMRAFGERIRAALNEDWDEVLIVGHSSGAHLAISILADLIRENEPPPTAVALGLLSLGQVVPMVSFLPEARRLRADLAYLSTRPELTWVDVTAPGDGCTFALCDPVAVSGVAPKDQRHPLILSAAFTQTLSPERWKALRWRFFRLHFQYLCAFDRPGDYDYFRITAGPRTLAERFAGREPSQSRITRASNPYTSVA